MNEKGYVYVEVIVVIAIIGIIFASGAIIGRNFLLNTMAEYEATKLISSIRYVQELNRNSYVVREGEFEKIEPENSTYYRVIVNEYYYEIKSGLNDFVPRKYNASKNIELLKTSSFNHGVRFYPNGDPKNIGNIRVKAKFDKKIINRYVIIDKAGRIRMDRKLE